MIISKSKVATIVLISALIFTVGGIQILNKRKTVQYNTNPDVSSKVVGSEKFEAFRIPSSSMEELLDSADLIILGDILTNGNNKEKTINASSEQDTKFMAQFSKLPTYGVVQADVKVNEVIYGDTQLEGKTIKFSQLGEAGNDDYQTKAKKGNQMLLILRKAEEENTYASVDFEDGMFLVDKNENNKLLSLSKNILVAKYDGLDLKVLKDDIKKAKKN